MAGFLYYRSGEAVQISVGDVRAMGLGYILDDKPAIACRQFTNAGPGPSGEAGTLFAVDGTRPGIITYAATKQAWRKLPRLANGDNVWVGYDLNDKPTPVDLARTKMLPSDLMITLSDGNSWSIPRACDWTENKDLVCALPRYLDYDDDGRLIPGGPVEQYQDLWRAVQRVAPFIAGFQTDAEAGVTNDEVHTVAGRLLQANYRVGLPELIVLKALADDDSLALIVTAATRGDALLSWAESQKKRGDQQDMSGSDIIGGEAA